MEEENKPDNSSVEPTSEVIEQAAQNENGLDSSNSIDKLKSKLENGTKEAENGHEITTNGNHTNGDSTPTQTETTKEEEEEEKEDVQEAKLDQKELKTSISNEFTYTSLGRPDLDEMQSDDPLGSPTLATNLTINEVVDTNDHNIDIKIVDNAAKLESLNLSNDNDADLDKSDADSLKKLPFDTIIERVKLNRVTNKEVCNYVLNLLVGGEFDLEKNFVIQNIKSILHMIQVIKCAQPSLKVNFRLD